MSIRFDCQPQNETPNLEAFYIMYLKDNKLTLRPAYQRNACWNDEQKTNLIDTIMKRCPMPTFLIYKYDEEMECIDGQNRLTTIKEYKEQLPPSEINNRRPFAWIIDHYDEDGDIIKTEYVYYEETPDFKVYITDLNNKNKKKSKEYRFMTGSEKSRFNDYGLVAQMIKNKLTFDQRKEIFNKWQNGSSISQCDALKNENTPFCNWVVSNRIEHSLGELISKYLKSSKKNWLFDVVRMLRVFLDEANPPSYAIISTLQTRNILKSSEFDKDKYDSAKLKLEKFLNSITPLQEIKKYITISYLLTYAYLWYINKEESSRSILENKEFMINFAKKSIENKDHNHSTLNNGPQIKSFMEMFPQIQQDLTIELSKKIPENTLKYKKKTISIDLKKKVWDKYHKGLGVAKCFCCRIESIEPLNFEAGHVIPESAGGPTNLDNLRPICRGCNRRMAATNMKDWMAKEFSKNSFYGKIE